jgi:hypothetical protein
MKGDRHPARLAIAALRERVLSRLSEAFVNDELGLDEFETRVDRAYQAPGESELTQLVTDLGPLPPAVSTELLVADAPITALASPQARRGRRVLALLGNVERRGQFQVPDGYRVTSVLGNVELDLRDVVFPEGVTHVHVRAVLGNIEIIVPPSLAVDCDGSGILASFASMNRLPAEGTGAGPLLRILGSAVLGNVEIRTLPRGLDAKAPRAPQLPPRRGEER